jgi:hypothetical protein
MPGAARPRRRVVGSDAAAVDRLVKALEANKSLLPLTKEDEAGH